MHIRKTSTSGGANAGQSCFFSRISIFGVEVLRIILFRTLIPLGMKYYSLGENLIYRDTHATPLHHVYDDRDVKLDNYITSRFSFMTTNVTKSHVITVYSVDDISRVQGSRWVTSSTLHLLRCA